MLNQSICKEKGCRTQQKNKSFGRRKQFIRKKRDCRTERESKSAVEIMVVGRNKTTVNLLGERLETRTKKPCPRKRIFFKVEKNW
jgi:hypothetical protein